MTKERHCSMPDCNRKIIARGLCTNHYAVARRRPNWQTTKAYAELRAAAAFWNAFEPEPNSGCWIWIGTANGRGYGRVLFDGKIRYAHRVSWIIHHGKIADGLHVLHKCDNTYCVNPDHLMVGSHVENMADMVRKNRHVHGCRHISAKLNIEQVAHVRRKEMSQSKYAKLYGVCTSSISRIQTGEHWKIP